MKKNIILLFLLAFAFASYAQADKSDKEERKQEIKANEQERKTLTKERVDYNLFHRQLVALKEYSDERKKIPALQKASKMPVKIVASIDSVDDVGDETKSKTLTGYISENIGDNSTNIYEVTYDRTLKKIISVKATGETSDIEQEETTGKKTTEKKTSVKKTKDEDDDDADEDQSTKKKAKDED